MNSINSEAKMENQSQISEIDSHSQISPKERSILIFYFLGLLAVVGLYLFFGVIRDGLPGVALSTSQVEIAVLAPLQGELGKGILDVTGQVVAAMPAETMRGLQVKVVGYDTRNTADGAARAARQAARNQNTVAIIGPLDARQVLAAVEVLLDQDLTLLTPASTAPTLPLGRYGGLYRLPPPDDLQGRAIVEFLTEDALTNEIFLISEPGTFSSSEVENFKQAAGKHVILKGEIALSGEGLPEDVIEQITAGQVDIVVYLGSEENGKTLQERMTNADLGIPVVVAARGEEAFNLLVQQPVYNGIFLIAEPFSYVQGVTNAFMAAAKDRLVLVDILDLGKESLPPDLANRILDSKANAVVYLGRPETALAVVKAISEAQLEIPVIGSDSLNDPGLLTVPNGSVSVYYTSPFLSLGALSEDESLAQYRQILAERTSTPYAYETAQATLMVLSALSQRSSDSNPRETVWRNIGRTAVSGYDGERFTFSRGQRIPRLYYIYQVSPETGDWTKNKLVFTFKER
jgi:ABC-type branched-subunit amino acid transport system substrate-binding protein